MRLTGRATTHKRSFLRYLRYAGVAQLVRVPACHAGGRGFEPRHSRQVSESSRGRPPPLKAQPSQSRSVRTAAAGVNRVPFVADGGPASPVAAVTMFRGAVIAASAAAAERFAALAAHAINRQANWQEAIGWVVKAADMGNAAAQLQMKVLPGSKDVRAQGSWLQLARRIDIRGLLGAPSLIRVHGSPAIALIEGLATPAMCRWLVQRADSPL
jgi:hypothetical protein